MKTKFSELKHGDLFRFSETGAVQVKVMTFNYRPVDSKNWPFKTATYNCEGHVEVFKEKENDSNPD